jgi:hypothetical protein
MFRVQVKIRYPRRVIRRIIPVLILAVLLVLASTSGPARSGEITSSPSLRAGSGMRYFYLTRTKHNAVQAPTACAPGYHFASIWEIVDPSGLRYNTVLGATSPDSGAGPPTATPIFLGLRIAHGWVRTGASSGTTDIPGQANCISWQSDYEFYWGTVANLPSNWTGGEEDMGVWNTEVRTCDTLVRVWCVQDDSVWRVYLPVVFR